MSSARCCRSRASAGTGRRQLLLLGGELLTPCSGGPLVGFRRGALGFELADLREIPMLLRVPALLFELAFVTTLDERNDDDDRDNDDHRECYPDCSIHDGEPAPPRGRRNRPRVVYLFPGQVLLAIGLFVATCLIGPGGYSIFRSNRT